jgi:hypothetical protein
LNQLHYIEELPASYRKTVVIVHRGFLNMGFELGVPARIPHSLEQGVAPDAGKQANAVGTIGAASGSQDATSSFSAV